MAKLILIPACQTDWRAQGRVAGDTDLPLNEIGLRQAVATGREIAALAPTLIRSGPEQGTKQTASLIAHELNLRLRTVKGLGEMKLGLWQGMTLAELEERFARVWRQWRDDPLCIEPPEGETVADCAVRLSAAVEKLRKKHVEETFAVAVGQYAFAVLRCRLIDDSYEHYWDYIDNEQAIQTFDFPARSSA